MASTPRRPRTTNSNLRNKSEKNGKKLKRKAVAAAPVAAVVIAVADAEEDAAEVAEEDAAVVAEEDVAEDVAEDAAAAEGVEEDEEGASLLLIHFTATCVTIDSTPAVYLGGGRFLYRITRAGFPATTA